MCSRTAMNNHYENLSHDDVIIWKHFPRNWPFVREIHRDRWIPRTKASDAELWCFLCTTSEYTIESTKQSWGWWFETLSRPLWRHCNVICCGWTSMTLSELCFCVFFLNNHERWDLWTFIVKISPFCYCWTWANLGKPSWTLMNIMLMKFEDNTIICCCWTSKKSSWTTFLGNFHGYSRMPAFFNVHIQSWVISVPFGVAELQLTEVSCSWALENIVLLNSHEYLLRGFDPFIVAETAQRCHT